MSKWEYMKPKIEYKRKYVDYWRDDQKKDERYFALPTKNVAEKIARLIIKNGYFVSTSLIDNQANYNFVDFINEKIGEQNAISDYQFKRIVNLLLHSNHENFFK